MLTRGQPYLGVFPNFKDENTDSDIVTDVTLVHPVVFVQITSLFSANMGSGEEESLTAILYPRRQLKITELESMRRLPALYRKTCRQLQY